MATTKKFLDYTGLQYFFNKLKGIFVQKTKAGESYLEVSTEKDSANTITATTIGFKSDVITGGTGSGYTGSTKLTTQGYVDEKVEAVSSAVISGLNITGTTENGFLKIEDKAVDIDSTKIANASGETIGKDTKLVSEKYVTEKISETVTKAVVYKGATATIPTGTGITNGDMYKVTAELTGLTYTDGGKEKHAKSGDVIIYNTGSTSTTKWDVIPAGDDVEYTGVKVGTTVVISATEGGDVDFATASGETLFTITGAAGKITFASEKKLTDAVTKIEGASADADKGVTIGDKTYAGANIVGKDGDASSANTIYGVKKLIDEKVGAIDAGVTAVTASDTVGAVKVNGTDVKIGGADDLKNLIDSGVTAVTVDGKTAISANTVTITSKSTYEESDTDWTADGAGVMSLNIGGNDVTIAQRITNSEIAAICV